MRKLAALHLADFTNRVLVEKTQTNINISTEKTLFILKSKTIPLELKLLALPSLIAVLQKDSKRIIRNIYEQNFKSILDQAILEDNIIDIEFTVLLANALLNTEMFDDKTGKFLQENFGRILKAVLIVLKKIPNIYNKEK